MKKYPIIVRSGGLDNAVDPGNIQYSEKTGVSSLAAAVNVEITSAGRIRRRSGKMKVVDGHFHSFFSIGTHAFVIKDFVDDEESHLFEVSPGYELKGLRRGLEYGAGMSFLYIRDRIYYANGHENGFVAGGLSYPWPKGEYQGIATTRAFSDAPVGHLLGFHAGRFLIAVDNTIYWSEPFEPGLFDMESGYVALGARVTMIRPVLNGIFVSDENEVSFLPTPEGSFKEMSREPVSNHPAYEWSSPPHQVQIRDFGLEGSGLGVIWTSPDGVCLGLPDGSMLNLTEEKIVFTRRQDGASLIHNGSMTFTMR